MTREEAIALLSNRYIVVSMHADKDYCVKNNDAIDMAIKAIKKQVPMKPNVYKEEYAVHYKCPKCGCRFVSKIDGEYVAGTRCYKYCYICGQRISWEGVE